MSPEEIHAWVKRNWGHDLDPDQLRCMVTVCSIANPYNLDLVRVGRQRKQAVEVHPWFVAMWLRSTLATYDFSELTKLVLAAHRNYVRIEISAATVWTKCVGDDRYLSILDDHIQDPERLMQRGFFGQSCLRLMAHHRKPDGDRLFERHPGLDYLAKAVAS